MPTSHTAPQSLSTTEFNVVASPYVDEGSAHNLEIQPTERNDKVLPSLQSDLNSTPRHRRPPAIRTKGLDDLPHSQSIITSRRHRAWAHPTSCEKGSLLERHTSRMRALDSATLDKPDRSRSPIIETPQASASSWLCLCQSDRKIPRPRNAFILYRQHFHQDIISKYPGIQNPDVSKRAGELWNSEPEEVKNKWRRVAEEEKFRHAQQFPNYSYRPRHKGKGSTGPRSFSEQADCNMCGGKANTGIRNTFPSTSPGRTLPVQPISAQASQALARDLSGPTTTSPQSPIAPQSPFMGPGLPDRLPVMQKKRKRNNQCPTGMLPAPVPNQAPREATQQGVNSGGFIRSAPYSPYVPTPTSAIGRDLLPLPDSPMTLPKRPLDLEHPDCPRENNSKPSIAPPGTPIGCSSFSGSNSLDHQDQRRSAADSTSAARCHAIPPTPRFVPSHSSTRDALRLSPLRGFIAHGNSMESIIMNMSFREKIKILRRVVMPVAKVPFTPCASSRVRGVIIAVEGDEEAPVDDVLARLEDRLSRTGEFNVTTIQGPRLPGSDASIGKYVEEIARWHRTSKALIGLVNGSVPKTNHSMSEEEFAATSTDVTDSNEDLKDRMDVDLSPSNTSTMPHKSTAPAPPVTHTHLFGRRKSTASHGSASTTTVAADKENLRIPIILISSYLVGTSDAWSKALPLNDMYTVKDHWQWTATLWRGVPGPDFTIYVRDEKIGHHQREASILDSGGNIEILEETGLMIIKSSKESASNGGDGPAIRRVAFEVGEWARVASMARITIGSA